MAGRPYVPWASRPYDLRQAKIPAFPGAEGGGMFTFGGRGGKVLTVTNLNDAGPGSFRWACEQGGARIIVFNVSGNIVLKTPIIVRAPYITIAGQTAPGEGVMISGESFQVDTHDVIVRHMRFRRGNTHVWYREDSFGGNPVGNIMIDHCSCEFGLDENISFYRHMFDLHDGKPKRKVPTVNVTIRIPSLPRHSILGTMPLAVQSVERILPSCVTSGRIIQAVTLLSDGVVCSTS